jgi:hypothetical protein
MTRRFIAVCIGCFLVLLALSYEAGTWGCHATPPITAHIARMQPQWEEFKRKNPGLEYVSFWDLSDSLGIVGVVPSKVQVAKVVAFVASTSPAWPLRTNEITVNPGQYMDVPVRRRMFQSANAQALARVRSSRWAMFTSFKFWLVILAVLITYLLGSVWVRGTVASRAEQARLRAIERESPSRAIDTSLIAPQIGRVRQDHVVSAQQRRRPGHYRSVLIAAARHLVTRLAFFSRAGHGQDLHKHAKN